MPSELRTTILNVAADALLESGSKGLTVRHLANEAETTTQAIYTLFGGKQGIVEALYEEGWQRLSNDLETIERDADPLEYLISIGLCYSHFAYENATFYQLIVGRSIGEFKVPNQKIKYVGPWQRFTSGAIIRAIDEGMLSGSIEEIGQLLWAICHGVIDLRLNGFLETGNQDDLLKKAALGIFNAYAGPAFSAAKLKTRPRTSE
ncbi:MAG: helix-turn-helix domain-containing protein [Pseudomonadota bacterium]